MSLTLSYGNEYFYTDEFKNIVRSCKEILIEQATKVPITDKAKQFAYRHNFHKYLREFSDGYANKIPEDIIWAVSFINGIEDPTKDFSHLEILYFITHEDLLMMTQTTRVIREK